MTKWYNIYKDEGREGELMDRLAIIISKSRRVIGCMSFNTPKDTVLDLGLVKAIIDNYNKNLIGKKLPEPVLAHRMLEEEDEACSLHSYYTIVMPKTHKMLEEDYPFYDFPISDNKKVLGLISLVDDENKDLINGSTYRAYIDIDEKGIKLVNFYNTTTKKELADSREISIFELEEDLSHLNFNPMHFHFNRLDDLIEFCEKNKEFTAEFDIDWMVFQPARS